MRDCYCLFGARVCRSMLKQDSDAEEATQEVFLEVFERARQYDERARFSTWLHRIAINHCLHWIEKQERRRAEELDEALVDNHPSPLAVGLAWIGHATDTFAERNAACESQAACPLLGKLAVDETSSLDCEDCVDCDDCELVDVQCLPDGTCRIECAGADVTKARTRGLLRRTAAQRR